MPAINQTTMPSATPDCALGPLNTPAVVTRGDLLSAVGDASFTAAPA